MVSSAIPSVSLPLDLKQSLQRGHLWIYRDHLPNDLRQPTGSWLEVRCGGFRAIGLYDAESPIAIRIFDRRQVPDGPWLERQVSAAWQRRALIRSYPATTNAYRLLNGEGDGLPGIVVDLYGPFAAVRLDSSALVPHLPLVVAAVERVAKPKGICQRTPDGLQVLAGRAPPHGLVVEEHGVRFHADLGEGQKTGLFLDHRENRNSLAAWCAGRSVLNLFAYTGGFSLYAARAGATHVVSVDSAHDALNRARDNVELNGLDPTIQEFVTADALQYLEELAVKRGRFDVIISDPPSFARNRSQRHGAIRAYERLHALALRVLARGGVYAAASCTSQVDVESFRATLAQAASRTDRRLQIIHEAGQAPDHPVLIGHPDGRYLKFIVVRCLDAPGAELSSGARPAPGAAPKWLL